MSTYKFPECGCEFEITGTLPDGRPAIRFNPDVEKINLNCKRTWDLLGSGNSKGLFQLESQLGQSLSKKLKPENIEQLAALISILRPSCLEAIHDGKSVTMHYIDRKNKEEEIKYFHPALKEILDKTMGECLYQEQNMQIAKDIAGFTLAEADELRKSISKKQPELMTKIKAKFLEGSKKQDIVTEEEAQQIFEWIEKAQRYQFNACVTDDTMVETKDGYITIADAKIGNSIKTIDNIYTTILNKYDNGIQDVYEVTLESGKTIKCTLDHKFLCENRNKYPLWEILEKNYKVLCEDNHVIQSERLISVTYLGKLPTVDIEVDHPQHIYYGNGILTSNSHAVAYAMNTYVSAYEKAHFLRAFFTSYLNFAGDKSKPFFEIRDLISNARLMGIDVQGPDFRYLHQNFALNDKVIRFGFGNIKGVGEKAWNKILQQIADVEKLIGISSKNWTWTQFLVHFTPKVNSTAISAFINSGALVYMKLSRTKMNYEYTLYNKFTPKELEWIKNYSLLHKEDKEINLEKILMALIGAGAGKFGACASSKRVLSLSSLLTTLIKPPYSLDDSPEWLASVEESLLGIPLTCTSLDACDTSAANCTCSDYIKGSHPKLVIMAAKIDDVHEIKTKTGKNKGAKMAFLKISDITANMDEVVIFPDTWLEAHKIAFGGNNVLLSGERSKDGNSFIVNRMWQI